MFCLCGWRESVDLLSERKTESNINMNDFVLLFTRLGFYLDRLSNYHDIYILSFTRIVSQSRTWFPEWPFHRHITRGEVFHPGPWLLYLPTSAFPGAQQFCCRLQTICSIWLQLLKQHSVQASRWPLSVPSAAVDFSTAPWLWCSWSAWHLPLWLEMWSPSLYLCKQDSLEHHRDTWKVNVAYHLNTTWLESSTFQKVIKCI